MYVSMKQPFQQEVTMVWFSRSIFTLPPNADVFPAPVYDAGICCREPISGFVYVHIRLNTYILYL